MAFPKFLRAGSAAAIALLFLVGCDDDPTGPVICTTIVDYTITQTVSDSLVPGDCQVQQDLSFVDFYELFSPSQMSVEFSLSSGEFNPFLYLVRGGGINGPVVALDGESPTTIGVIHILMAPDTYVIGANALSRGQTGSYSLSSAPVSDQAENCAEIWVTLGIATAQSIADTDCSFTDQSGEFYYDEFVVILGAGESITITMTSPAIDSFLELYNFANDRVAFNDNFGGAPDSRIVYTAPDEDIFFIVASTFDPDTTGAYALAIN